MEKIIYDCSYFIRKFEAIPEEKWIIGNQQDDFGRHCAFGHCLPKEAEKFGTKFSKEGYCGTRTDEGIALTNLFNVIGRWPVYINNWPDQEYPQPTPKQRILAALYDIKKMSEPIYKDATSEIIEKFQSPEEKTDVPLFTQRGRKQEIISL